MATSEYTLEQRIATFWSKVDKSGGDNACWLWTGFTDIGGYGRFGWNGRRRPSHRVSWEITHGEIPDGLLICHTCDNPPCVNPAHLWLGTHLDNMRDMREKGRSWTGDRNGTRTHPETVRRGESHGRAKLTEDEVRAMRVLYASGKASFRKLAKQFGISKSQAGSIVTYEYWKHLE